MNFELITVIVMVATVIALLAYDVYAIKKGGVEASISQVMLNSSKKFPLIPFLFGMLCGHFFWQNC